jgi:peptide deformylase
MPSTSPPQGLEVITVDGPRAAILHRKAKPVRVITRDIQSLIDQMFETLERAHGLGLAAPQVGVSERILIAEVEKQRIVLVNPQMLRQEGETVATEACLSIPGLLGDVPRASRIVVRGRNRHNRGVKIEAEGLLARVLQHEIDHLDGILFPQRVRDKKSLRSPDETAQAAVPAK